MKQIIKNDPPHGFVRWINRERPISWNAIHTEKAEPVYRELVEALRHEQGNLCCYCEQELQDDAVHVEHFEERSRHPESIFDYENLHASCNGDHPENRDDKHCCGHKRQSIAHANLLSPLGGGVEQRFSYDNEAQLKPTNIADTIVQTTIDILELNCEKLVGRRKTVRSQWLTEEQNMDETEFAKWIQWKLSRDSEGRFIEFWTLVDYFVGSRREEWLAS